MAESERDSEQQDSPSGDEVPSSSEQDLTKKFGKKQTLLIVGGTAVAAIVIAVSLAVSTAPSKLQDAKDVCVDGLIGYMEVSDDGQQMFIDGAGETSFGVDLSITLCVLDALEIPRTVESRIYNTTAIMGQQEAFWDDIVASWSYHPDRGLDLSLTLD